MHQLVSVVIPTYNRPKRLARAIRSVFSQSYDNYEIIVVDDSEDLTAATEVVQQLNDTRVRYFPNAGKKGANGARNTGILNANGDYIAFLDDDDEWVPEKLSWQMEFMNAHQEMCGVFSAYSIRLKKSWKTRNYQIDYLEPKHVLLNAVSIGSSSNLLMKASVFSKVGIWDEDMFRQQDLELLVRVSATEKIGYDNRVVMKVDGRNNPEPKKAMIGQGIYLDKVRKYVDQLERSDRDQFYSNYYRRLCMYQIRLNRYSEAISHYKEALKYQLVNPSKDINNLYLLTMNLPKYIAKNLFN